MVKRILIASSIVVLSGCYEPSNNSYQFNWAVANNSLLEGKVLEVAKTKYPYPDEIALDKHELREEGYKISSQISKLKSTLKKKCLEEARNKKDSAKPSERLGNVVSHPGAGYLVRPQRLPECVGIENSDPLIQDLNARKEKLNTISRKQSEHDRKLRDLSKAYVKKLIGDYSKSKLQVVVDGGSNHILYNSSGVTLDITDVLISMIDENQLGPLSSGGD